MRILWFLLKNLMKFFLWIIIIPCAIYFSLVYKDAVLSMNAKRVVGGEIVYSLAGPVVRVIDISSGTKKNIYSASNHEGEGSFSRDGSRIVFNKAERVEDNYRYNLYIMNSNGTGSKKILELGDTDIKCPSWSPDGKKIAFILQKPHGQGGLYIFEIDNPYVSLQMVSNVRPALYEPTWSPDSNKISFVSDEYITRSINEKWYSEMFVGRVFIVNSDGTDLRTINADTPVLWSPDGSKLLYRGEEGYYISNEDGSNKRLIVSYKKPFLSMSVGWGSYYPGIWSPDGKYFAFVKQIWPGLCGLGIYVVSVDDPKEQIRVATESGDILDMVWLR